MATTIPEAQPKPDEVAELVNYHKKQAVHFEPFGLANALTVFHSKAAETIEHLRRELAAKHDADILNHNAIRLLQDKLAARDAELERIYVMEPISTVFASAVWPTTNTLVSNQDVIDRLERGTQLIIKPTREQT